MGSSEVDKSSKEEKEVKEPKNHTTQEQASTASGSVAPDWSVFQAYSPMPPPGFLASSPQTHPYMWGVQQFIPPPPYVSMYPHAGMYAHPPTMAPGPYPFSPLPVPSPNGIAETSGNTPGAEVDGKSSEAKGKLPIKRSRGSLGSLNMLTGKNNEDGKTSGGHENGVRSKSSESVSKGSSEGSDANFQTESQGKSDGQPDSEPSQNGGAVHISENGGPNMAGVMVSQSMGIMPMPVGTVSGVPGPATNLNIGMDYWNATPTSAIPAMRGKVSASLVTGGIGHPGSRDNMQSQHWVQDERELKKQRRKQSNRESARRSRQRKQAEGEELTQRADALKEENASLRAELDRVKSQIEEVRAENASLKGKLGELTGQEDPKCSSDDQH
ncbi:bZIP transcription factor 16-like [Andrographis paniculata]|uniref:bZIP transcription factor 16-like n=1 Tax=Andrographis paniculata TaxID=175694 RepID=UPI0021E89A00|nr:bZIP transcription factor 16-like [Andrographis paniculata]XP_051151249.1 bZIP transcription factor 16-like [Andrographis paniculata]XP_051151250.1 bZIP transcription factor 16-like [Andrographis paniculata]